VHRVGTPIRLEVVLRRGLCREDASRYVEIRTGEGPVSGSVRGRRRL